MLIFQKRAGNTCVLVFANDRTAKPGSNVVHLNLLKLFMSLKNKYELYHIMNCLPLMHCVRAFQVRQVYFFAQARIAAVHLPEHARRLLRTTISFDILVLQCDVLHVAPVGWLVV